MRSSYVDLPELGLDLGAQRESRSSPAAEAPTTRDRDPRGRALTLRAAARSLVRFALHAVSGFAGVIGLALIVPSFFGYGSLTVLSGSMVPTLHVGDVVVEHHIRPLSVRVGDIVTFRVPEHQSRLYTHRVVSMEAVGSDVSFVTRGDANTGVERWTIPASGTIGRVQLRIPYLGYATNRAGSRIGRFGLLVIPAILLAVAELRRIWRRSGD